MILKRLLEFGESLPDSLPPGYQKALITKLIELREDGSLRQVYTRSGEGSKQRPGRMHVVPREQPQRTVGIVPRLLADNANYALGMAREKDKPETVAKRHEAYLQLLRECASSTQEPAVRAVLEFIEGGGASQLAQSAEISAEDDLDFKVGDVFPCSLPSVRQFWAARLDAAERGICLVTGEEGPIVDRMPVPIKGVPGGQPTGTSLVSVNNASCESYGLRAAGNSPIGAGPAETICNALNYLLATDKHRIRVGKAVFVAWTAQTGQDMAWGQVQSPDPERVKMLIQSTGVEESPLLYRGASKKLKPPVYGATKQRPKIADRDFFVLSLSANVSRIVIRDTIEATLSEVKENIAKWFLTTEISDYETGQAKHYGLFPLAASLYRDASKEMPAHVPVSILNCALKGTPLPPALLALAVNRNRASRGPFYELNGKPYLCGPRLALIKAVIQQHATEYTNLNTLNENHPDPAYHCGRLLAVLESIQWAALGEVNATIVDRYYGAACTSPGTVLGALLKDAQSHLAKLRKSKGDAWAQMRLADVLSAIGDRFPKTLTVTQQGLFALGFYHQKAASRASAIEHSKKNQGENQ